MRRRYRRKLPRGSYKKRGYGRRSKVTVKARSLSVTCWLGNPVGSDHIGSRIIPFVGATNVLDSYVYITNSEVITNLAVFSTEFLDKYKEIFEFMYISSMWVKYTPAITQGTQANSEDVGQNGGAVAGTLTMMCTNNMDKDAIDYPLTGQGVLALKTNIHSTTFSIYKPCFMRFTPKIKVDIADGARAVTRYVPYKVQLDSDNWLDGGNCGVMIRAQVPVEAGVQYSAANPFSGGNWPTETYAATIGKFEMGATCHFYGLRI